MLMRRSTPWEVSKEKARRADVVIALYNGQAGWLGTDSPVKAGVGVCHAELLEALNKSPDKVRGMKFNPLIQATAGSPDESFQQYVKSLHSPALRWLRRRSP